MSDAEQIASQVREALMLLEYFEDSDNWGRLEGHVNAMAAGGDSDVVVASVDIGSDMLTEWGLYTDENVDTIHDKLHMLFQAAFLMGNAYSPENDGDDPYDDGNFVTTKTGSVYRLADGVPTETFFDMADKAYDALQNLASDPQSPFFKGAYDMANEMLRSILHIDEKDSYWVLLDYAIGQGSVSK